MIIHSSRATKLAPVASPKQPEAQPKVEKKSERKRRERQQKIEVTEQLPIDVAEKAKKILEEIEEEVKSENE